MFKYDGVLSYGVELVPDYSGYIITYKLRGEKSFGVTRGVKLPVEARARLRGELCFNA